MGSIWPYFGNKNNASEKSNNPKKLDRNFRKEIKRLEKKLKSYRNSENSQSEAKCLEEIGFLYFDREVFENAMDYWKDALRVYQETNDRKSMAESYSNIGTACRLLGDLRQATRFYNKALLLDHEFNLGIGELKSIHNLAGTWLDLGEHDNALDVFNNALEIARENRNSNWEALSLYRIGLTYQASHQYREAFRFFEEGLKVAEKTHHLEIMTYSTFGLGQCYDMMGEYSQAFPCYQDALEGAINLKDQNIETLIQVALAHLYTHIGQADIARKITREATANLGDDTSVIVQLELNVLNAKIYGIHGMWEKAFSKIQIAEEQAENLPNGFYLAQVLLTRADFELECGHFDKSLEIIKGLRTKYPEGSSTLVDLETVLALGLIYRGLKKDEIALKFRESAILKAQYLAVPKFLWRAHHSLGRFYHHQRRFDQAREHYQTALKWIDRETTSLEPAQRPIFQSKKQRLQVYQDYVILQITTGHKEAAARTLKRLNSDTLNRKVQHFFK